MALQDLLKSSSTLLLFHPVTKCNHRHMGLDGVEIIMNWEEAFGITVTDAEAQSMATPKRAIEIIAFKLQAIEKVGSPCLSARAFRRLVNEIKAITRETDVRPSTKVSSLFPEGMKGPRWEQLGRNLNAGKWPHPWFGKGWFVGIATVRDLLHRLLAASPKIFMAPDEPWTTSHVRCVVRAVVASQLLRIA
jgi:hypothetical protein